MTDTPNTPNINDTPTAKQIGELPLTHFVSSYNERADEVKALEYEQSVFDKEIADMIAKEFPRYQQIKDELEYAKMSFNQNIEMIKIKGLQVDPSALSQYGGALVFETKQRVVHFDEQQAIAYARKHPEIAESAGLIEYKALPSKWLSAIKQSAINPLKDFPSDIIKTDDVTIVKIIKSKIQKLR